MRSSPGLILGETDEFGFGPIGESVHVRDIHATLLHQLGLNHERLLGDCQMPNDSQPANGHWTIHEHQTTTTSRPVASTLHEKRAAHVDWTGSSPYRLIRLR